MPALVAIMILTILVADYHILKYIQGPKTARAIVIPMGLSFFLLYFVVLITR